MPVSPPKPAAEAQRFPVDDGTVSALWLRPDDADVALVLAHGAGADMHHVFMENTAHDLAARRIATLRFQFPYTEAGRRAPNRAPTLKATIRAALDHAAEQAGALPRVAAGKSMGGRMTSLLAAEEGLAARGIVFFGFPLHAAGKPPSTERGEHLREAQLPLLFLQGTRDKLADLALLEPLIRSLGARARLHVVDGADHGFHVLKRSGRTPEDVRAELADATRAFLDDLLQDGGGGPPARRTP